MSTSGGRWTEDDAQALRGALASLPPEEQAEITRGLALVVNGGALRVETQGPLF